MKAQQTDVLSEALKVCRKGFAAVALFSFFINMLMLTAPLYMLQIFDRVLSSRSHETLLVLTLVAGMALLILAVLDALRGFILLRLGAWLDRRISVDVLKSTIGAAVKVASDSPTQNLRDISTLRGFIGGSAVFPLMDAPWTPIFLLVMFILHPLLGLVAVVGALFLFALAILNELLTRTALHRSSGAQLAALRQAEAAVRNADAIEAMGMLPNMVRRWAVLNALALTLQTRAASLGGAITAGTKFLRMALQIAIFACGAWLVIGNELSPGAMIAGAILMSRALAPVEQAIGSWRAMVAAREAYRRVRLFLAENPHRTPMMELPRPEGRVLVDKVGYVHPGTSAPTLRGVRFSLEPGEGLGLIGPSAAGKTTLARLLIGNLKPRAGHVRLDGMDVAQWNPEDLGRYVGYVPQDVELFSGTVRENIARMGEGDPEAVIAAAQLAGVHDMILQLPRGYDTQIGSGGAALSGGQRQRIALARAVYGRPSLLVLDEPSSNLDSDGENALLQAIEGIKALGTTFIVIAHRPNILRQTDKILVLRRGTVQMFGPREKVLAKVAGPQRPETVPTETEEAIGNV